MIRINLLPVRASKKRELGRQWLVLFALMAIAAVVGNYFWYSNEAKRLATINQRISKYESDLATLKKIIGEVDNIKAEQEEMNKKLATLATLRAGRKGPVRVMDELSVVIPERVWLRSYEDRGGRATLQGYAVSHEEVSHFLRTLKASRHFSNPTLKFTKQAGEHRVEYEVSAGVVYDVPQG